ncbi:MAG TPA: recombinase family protein [Gemmataceae bacterium]|jgi:DNA invertase Pin-like site-specific DNA recombinase|nr:recombinase family protein [Gemmataceae bacterium]
MAAKKRLEPAVAYSYQRFSSPEQRKGDSIRRQAHATEAWCSRNKVRLDDKLRFVDAGVSSFRGKHRSSDKFALGYFLSLVQSGRIKSGSYLVLESLDRLSREDVDEALRLLLSLTGAGIRVVQLSPVEVEYQKPVDMTKLIMGIMEMSRGNSESKMKSERIGAAWENKRAKARASKTAVSARCPGWLRRKGESYEPIPERAAAVRRMFELSAEGFGINGIIRRLIEERHEPFGRSGRWSNSYLGHILSGRVVLGEYQPTKAKAREGGPITGYYPVIIDEKLYYRVQAGLKQRLNHSSRRKDGAAMPSGGRSRHDVNLFAGLMFHALDGDRMEYRWFTDTRQGNAYGIARYVNSLALIAQATLRSFPVKQFEQGVLSCLAEIDPIDVLPGRDRSADDVTSLSAQLNEIENQLEKIEDRLATPGEVVEVLVNAAKRLQAKRKVLADQLSEARLKASNPQGEAWGTCHTLITALESCEDREAARMRLRSAIRRVVEKMTCLFVRNGRRQIACVQFQFIGSPEVRTVFIRHRGELVNIKERTPAHTSFSTMVDGLPGKVDLNNPSHRKLVTSILTTLCEEENWQRAVEPDRPTSKERIRLRKLPYSRAYKQRARARQRG